MSNKIVFIVGPTASGKSDLALELAQKLNGEIINADSIQVYDGLDIGSAKPTPQELKKAKHHLIGHVSCGEKYTAGRFREDVLNILSKEKDQLYFVVGGSGFYLKALMTGLYSIPQVPEEIKKQINSMSLSEQYQKLQDLDPEYAKKINANDSYRIHRALEVCLFTEKSFTEFQRKFSKEDFPYDYKKIGLRMEKSLLRERIEKRVQKMIQAGLIQEVQALLDKGFEGWPALESVGYKEVKMFLQGELPEEKLQENIVKNTMALVKKQMTWFKKDSEIHWFEVGTKVQEVKEFLSSFLRN